MIVDDDMDIVDMVGTSDRAQFFVFYRLRIIDGWSR